MTFSCDNVETPNLWLTDHDTAFFLFTSTKPFKNTLYEITVRDSFARSVSGQFWVALNIKVFILCPIKLEMFMNMC